MIYLFSSDARDRYIQDILNVMALPRGALYQFRYEDTIVDDQLSKDAGNPLILGKYIGQEVLIIFVNQIKTPLPLSESDISYFFPIRRGSITSLSFEGKVLIIQFAVKDFIDWQSLFVPAKLENKQKELEANHTQIKEIHKLITASTNPGRRPPKKYVTIYQREPNISFVSEKNKNSETKAWQHCVMALSLLPEFENTIFFRVSAVRETSETFISKFLKLMDSEEVQEYRDREVNLKKILPNLYGYILKGGKAYLMNLDFFRLNDPPIIFEETKISTTLDSTFFSYLPQPIRITFRYDSMPIPLMTSGVNQDTFTGLNIHQEMESSINKGLSQPVRSPELYLLIKLTYNRASLWLQFILLFIAQLLIVFAGKVTNILNNISAPIELINMGPKIDLVLTILGPLLSVVMLFLLYKRLPSGSSS